MTLLRSLFGRAALLASAALALARPAGVAASPPAAGAPAAALTSVPADAELLRQLRTRVDVQRWATGAVVGIIDGDGRRIVAYGTPGARDRRPMTGDTVFAVGSITKVFTALVAADLASRGALSLQDPVARYLPRQARVPTIGGREITLVDLATHTAGLPLRPDNLRSRDANNPYAGYSETRLLDFLRSFTPPRAAGADYEYSNVGYGVLALALTSATHQSYQQLVATRIAQPLGLRSTAVVATRAMRRQLAIGHTAELAPAPRWSMGALEGAGALHSSANDLLTLLEVFLGYRASGLAPAMRTMTELRRPGGMQPAQHIALAWNVLVSHEHELFWKNGSVGGFRAFVGWDAKSRRGVVALANAQTAVGLDDIGLHLLDPAIPVDLTVPHRRVAIALAPAVLERYVGSYRYSETDVLTVTREGAQLFAQAPGMPRVPIYPESERAFFYKVINVQLTFEVSGAGIATAAVWHQGGQEQRGERSAP